VPETAREIVRGASPVSVEEEEEVAVVVVVVVVVVKFDCRIQSPSSVCAYVHSMKRHGGEEEVEKR